MKKDIAEPTPTPSPTLSVKELCLPFLHNLTLEDKTKSMSEHDPEDQASNSRTQKMKFIEKRGNYRFLGRVGKNSQAHRVKESNKKKMQKLEQHILELESENDRLRRKLQCCTHCFQDTLNHNDIYEAYQSGIQEEMKKFSGEMETPNPDRGSHGSLEFQSLEFRTPGMQIDDKAWVFLGTIMIAMGSKCMDVDGTLNVFKVLKESVDNLRRQVEKSESNISMDFFISKEEMQENPLMQEIGFDPFCQKLESSGFNLEGVKVDSVEQFQLTYDSKLTYNLKYEVLLGAMQYIRDNSWINT